MPEVIEGVDLAGSCVGFASPDDVIDGEGVEKGDRLIGIPSNGIHSNGLTLARKAVTQGDTEAYHEEAPYAESTVGEELLKPTRIYTEPLRAAQNHDVCGMAHITGGGFTNLERLADFGFVIENPLPVPPIFELIQKRGDVSDKEMYRTFNMGTGFVLVVPEKDSKDIAETVGGSVIGRVEDGECIRVDGVKL